MTAHPRSVRLAQINTEDCEFKISDEQSSERSVEALAASIAQVGLIHPPFVFSRPDAAWAVVSGFRRIRACRQLGWSEIPVCVVPPERHLLEVLALAVADNAQHRELSLIEQARAVAKLSPFFTREADLAAYCEPLGLSLNRELVSRLKRINRLSPVIRDCIGRGSLSLSIALELEKLDGPAAEALAGLFDALRPTLSQQKEMLSLATDIAAAGDLSVPELLETGEMAAIRGNRDFNRQQKIKQVRAFLKKRRYPVIEAFEAAFEKNRRALDLPEAVALRPPPDFEAQRFSIVVTFQTAAELAAYLKNLERLPADPHFNDIMNKRLADSDAIH